LLLAYQLQRPRLLTVTVLCPLLLLLNHKWIFKKMLTIFPSHLHTVIIRLWWVALLVWCHFFRMLIFCARNCGCCLLIESLLVVPNMSAGFLLCLTIGILQNFLEGCDSEYFKAFFSQFSILTGKIFSHLEFSNWLTSSHMFLQIFQWLANMPGELEGCIRPVCPVLTIFIAVPNIMWINVRVRLDVL
jgi:hypothetical protein